MIKKILAQIIFSLIIIISLTSENWVGQAATYQLIEGTKTASGEAFNSNNLTAACNGFKIGAEITVINAKTGKKVNVIINDRIKQKSNYFILLTPKTAQELEMEWETGLVVLNADFSDVNSNERLFIDGLVHEGEFDVETIKKFPEINWPEINNTVSSKYEENKDQPGIDDQKYPDEKDSDIKLDQDEKNALVKNETTSPYEEVLKTPDSLDLQKRMDKDISPFLFSQDDETEFVESDKESLQPNKDDYIYPTNKQELKMDNDLGDIFREKPEVVVVNKSEEKLEWLDELPKGEIYIRFSATYEQHEGERRLMLFNKVFPRVVGLRSGKRYVLLVGPVKQENLNTTLKSIRKFGYKDAYIIKK